MATIASNQSDVGTLDGLIHTMYAVLSGPAGQQRDWDRLRSLYHPSARLNVVPPNGCVRALTVDEFIRRVEPIFAAEDFFERETNRQTETFGNVAHVLSSYECARTTDGPPFYQTTKSLQLVNDGTRWWILSAVWNTPRNE